MTVYSMQPLYPLLLCGQTTALSVALTVFIFLFLIAAAFIVLLFAVPSFRALFFKNDADNDDGKDNSQKAAPPAEEETDMQKPPKRKRKSGGSYLDAVLTVPLLPVADKQPDSKRSNKRESSDSANGTSGKPKSTAPATDGKRANKNKQKTATAKSGNAKSKKSEK